MGHLMILLVLLIVAAIGATWLTLLVSGWLSLRWTRRAPTERPILRLSMAVLPVFLGSFLFGFHLRWRMNDVTINLSWPFAMPIAIGVFALIFWIRAQWRLRNPA